ncbi:hypothetical protein B484DRAFT_469530, partial [Ochromonadaceae sp. CCMP2298]
MEQIYPTIRQIVEQINGFLAYCVKQGRSAKDCSMWKVDVKGAYTLQDYASEDCPMFMSELEGGLVMIYTCGCFGFAGQPMAFDVVTRALRWELKNILRGVGNGYVDDFFGIILTDDLLFDMSAITAIIRKLLGEKAIAEKKSQQGRRIELIGWTIDLEKQLVTIGERCLQRALYGYAVADEFAPMPLKQLQRLASWARRYGEVNRLLLPFTTALNHATRGKTNPHCKVTLGARARQAIQMIRVLLLLTATDEGEFARPLDSWVADQPPYQGLVAEFDASLRGIGILWFLRAVDGSERLLGVAVLDIQSLGFGADAGNQNVAEYIATTAATRGARLLADEGLLIDGKPPVGVWLRGDIVTALNTLQTVTACMPVLGTFHLPAADNKNADIISRLAQGKLTLRQAMEQSDVMRGARVIDPRIQVEKERASAQGRELKRAAEPLWVSQPAEAQRARPDPLQPAPAAPRGDTERGAGRGEMGVPSQPAPTAPLGDAGEAVGRGDVGERSRPVGNGVTQGVGGSGSSSSSARPTPLPQQSQQLTFHGPQLAQPKQWFAPEQVASVGEFMGERDRSKASSQRYKAGWSHWVDFIAAQPADRRPDPFLTEMGSEEDKALFVALFIQHLYHPPHNLRGKSLTANVTHVKGYFAHQPLISSALFESATVKTAKKCAARRGKELKAARKAKAAGKKVPLCHEMVDHARTHYWESKGWTGKGMDCRAKYLGMATMADAGCRNSNLTGPTKVKGEVITDHGMTCDDVKVEVTVPPKAQGAETTALLNAGPGKRDCLLRNDVRANDYSKMMSISFTFLTTKTTKDGTDTVPAVARLGRTTEREERLLVDWLDWFVHNEGQLLGDYVLSRYSPETGKRRLLQRADLADIIKATAVSFDMPPSAFSTSSGRKGYTTHCIANGMQAPEMHQRTDWARDSKVPLTFYNTQVTNRGMMALEGDAFGIGDVRRQVSRPVAQYPGADDTALSGQGSSSGPGGELPDKGASDTVRGEGAGESSSSESDYSDDSEDER